MKLKRYLFLLVFAFWMCGTVAQQQRILSNQSTTSLVNSFIIGTSCGSTIASLTVSISTPIIAGVTTYTFRVTNLASGAIQIITRPVNSFALSNYSGIAYNTAYHIEVSTNGGLNYGPTCLLYTPSPTCTIGAQCNTTLDSMTQFVYCTYVPGVIGYRFRITNLTTNAVQIFDASLNRFYFNQLTDKAYATTYFIEVAVKNSDNTYLAYNAGCNITTMAFPTTAIQNSQCKSTVNSFKQNIYADYVAGASDYRFLVSRAGFPTYSATIERALNYFKFSLFPALQMGTTYSVQVALKIGGEWGPYGPVCHITTSGGAFKMESVATEFKAVAYPNPFANNFMLDVATTDVAPVQLRVYDMLGKQIENKEVLSSQIETLQIGDQYPSGAYNVIVSQGENLQTLRIIKR